MRRRLLSSVSITALSPKHVKQAGEFFYLPFRGHRRNGEATGDLASTRPLSSGFLTSRTPGALLQDAVRSTAGRRHDQAGTGDLKRDAQRTGLDQIEIPAVFVAVGV